MSELRTERASGSINDFTAPKIITSASAMKITDLLSVLMDIGLRQTHLVFLWMSKLPVKDFDRDPFTSDCERKFLILRKSS